MNKKDPADVSIYLFKAGPIFENGADTVCASYKSSGLWPKGGGHVGTIDSKVEDIALSILKDLNVALGKYSCAITTYNKLEPRAQEVEDRSVIKDRTPLPEDLYKNITSALQTHLFKKLKIE